MSSVAVASFRWLDTLEKEFDTAFVHLDSQMNDLLNESENGDLCEEIVNDYVYNSREMLTVLSSAWAQLVHKSQTIYEINCKQEAQMVNLKVELADAISFKKASEKELEKIMIELHSAQIQVQKLKSSLANTNTNSSYVSYAASFITPDTSTADENMDMIQKKLDSEMEKRFGAENTLHSLNKVKEELETYKKENSALKEQVVNMTSEVYGARLAAKYLDKELAGRIQQIQLFGKKLKNEEHTLLWNQLEAEIHLHRHKTVIKACRNKRKKQNNPKTNNIAIKPTTSTPHGKINSKNEIQETESLKKNELIGEIRTVKLKRNSPNEGLGLSITGGREHGVPILISEIHDDGPAARSNELFIGDAILNVNDVDLKESSHSEAVEILSNIMGEIKLEVLFAASDDESETESNVAYDYPFLEDLDDTISSKSSIKTTNDNASQSPELKSPSNHSTPQSDFKQETSNLLS